MNFVLAWLGDEELRQRIGRQLNKGEQLHTACAAPSSMPTTATSAIAPPDQQAEQALSPAIVVNALLIAWNTVDIQRVLDELRAAGELITTSEIEHSHRSPTSTSTCTATNPFDLATQPDGHRPLRTPRRSGPDTRDAKRRDGYIYYQVRVR